MAGRSSGFLVPSTAPSLPLFFFCSPTTTRSRFVASIIAGRGARPPSRSLSRQFDAAFRLRYRFSPVEPSEEPPDGEDRGGFDGAVSLFNDGDYHRCHDVLEEIWYAADEPIRTLVHGILQCAVGMHHLFNHNHRGAMMELGEGLCKLRKVDFDDGPFVRFEREISEVLEFLYQTQKEFAAYVVTRTMFCSDRHRRSLPGNGWFREIVPALGLLCSWTASIRLGDRF